VQCSEACFYTARSCFSVAGMQHAWMVSAWFWYMCCDQMFPHCVLFFAVIAIIEVEGQKFCLDGSVQDDFHALQSELCLGLDALVNFGQRMP